MWTPPSFADQAPSTQTAVAPAPQPQQDDFMGQYQTMLAPYQQRAQRIFGGDPVFGNSAFVQNHPTASHVMSNLLLAASKAQPGMTPADSIRIAAQMAMAPREARQQQQMHLAMAPGQMMSPELQLMQHLSTIREQAQRGQYYESQTEANRGWKADLAQTRADRLNAPKPIQGLHTDDTGREWQEIYDPKAGKSRLFDPESQTYADDLEKGKQPSFKNLQKQRTDIGKTVPERLYADEQEAIATGDKDKIAAAKAKTERVMAISAGIVGAGAAARTGAEQTTPHPQADMAATISETRQHLYDDMPPMQDRKSFYASYGTSPARPTEKIGEEEQGYQKQVVEPSMKARAQRKANFENWAATSARHGERFDPTRDYVSGSQAQSSIPSTTPTPSGKSWRNY